MPFDNSQYYRTSCNAGTPVVRLSQGQTVLYQYQIKNDDNEAIDITSIGADVDGLGSSSSADNTVSVKFAVANTLGSQNIFTIDCTIIDGTEGTVEIKFTTAETTNSGMFTGSIGIFRGDKLVFQQLVYLEIMPNNFSALDSNATLTVPEVRMELMDVCPGANYLLDELEFTDNEIVHAMRKAVDMYNEMPPPVGAYAYNNFPYRANWINGTVGILLQMIAFRYRRNALQYSSGGVTIADQEKAREYAEIGIRLEEQYRLWAQQTRIGMNMKAGFKSVGRSAYRWRMW